MSTRTLAVVTAGLGGPSSTRLLADRLAAAVADETAERGEELFVEVIELRDHAHALTDALLTGFPSPLAARVRRAAGELADLVAGSARRPAPVDPFADPTPFAQLLAGT